MSFIQWIRDGLAHRRVAIFLKVVAVFMFLGALSHLGSILSMPGRPSWGTQPLYIQVFDVVLLLVNLALAWGLWRTKFWGLSDGWWWYCSCSMSRFCFSSTSLRRVPAIGRRSTACWCFTPFCWAPSWRFCRAEGGEVMSEEIAHET
jgi:hypothetical protein